MTLRRFRRYCLRDGKASCVLFEAFDAEQLFPYRLFAEPWCLQRWATLRESDECRHDGGPPSRRWTGSRGHPEWLCIAFIPSLSAPVEYAVDNGATASNPGIRDNDEPVLLAGSVMSALVPVAAVRRQ